MFPEHCREVGVKRVDFELTEAEIKSQLEGRKLYTATRYLVLHNEDSYAVCLITKAEGFELFREVTSLEVLALPDDTLYIEDPLVDVINPTKLVARAEEARAGTGAKMVVIKGQFDHISFAFNETRRKLIVFETVPPYPPKLVKMVENVVESGRLTQPVELKPEYIKVEEMAAEEEADCMVFPCRTSGLETPGRKTLYLDELPDLSEMTGKVVLVGCSLSDRIFKSHYHRKPELKNICPADNTALVKEQFGETPVILKCCKFKDNYEIEGNIIKVPWGTTTRIIEEALNDYFSRAKLEEEGGC